MPVSARLAWWSPDPRGVLPLAGFVESRSLRRSRRRYEVRVDTAFDAVIDGCRTVRRPGGWISQKIVTAYRRLHRMGLAHSIETWSADGRLVGGLYGVGIGGLFAGESMYHLATDASKVALAELVERLGADGEHTRLLDVQWRTDHLASLGVVEIPRREYLQRLDVALRLPDAFLGRSQSAGPPAGSDTPTR